ncbi:hypothetical protein PV394_16175 [Streptomyces sp. NE06-03E]|uniref:hypothetical protein n=1 Tax=Streptomyces sp. NE06-03E TaxID=3028695 RepID=UPI0029B4852B|nr:hypothetical protein [Streptomyces sp. NE06-03E]MDX3056665.1 hypothetical protein [Streptomyces sp. NE06-03E]
MKAPRRYTDDELAEPLWMIPPADRCAFLIERQRAGILRDLENDRIVELEWA